MPVTGAYIPQRICPACQRSIAPGARTRKTRAGIVHTRCPVPPPGTARKPSDPGADRP